MRVTLSVAALAFVAACTPPIPDSNPEAGASDYWTLGGTTTTQPKVSPIPEPRAVSEETLATLAATAPATGTSSTSPAASSGATAGATTAATTAATADVGAPVTTIASTAVATTPVTTPPAATVASADPTTVNGVKVQDGVVQASPSNPAPTLVGTPGAISDENDFEAVDGRRSIEDDAALLATNRENYTVIEPTALPKRVDGGPNVVAYALATNNPVGTRVYQRMGLTSQTRHERNCAKYASEDQAQIEFLSKGGPKNDRLGLDPDGDGFACGWDPSAFRRAAGG